MARPRQGFLRIQGGLIAETSARRGAGAGILVEDGAIRAIGPGLAAPLINGRPDQRGSTGRNHGMFVKGVPWVGRTGSPWRDPPKVFGAWNNVVRRFSRWSEKRVWRRVFEAMSDAPEFA